MRRHAARTQLAHRRRPSLVSSMPAASCPRHARGRGRGHGPPSPIAPSRLGFAAAPRAAAPPVQRAAHARHWSAACSGAPQPRRRVCVAARCGGRARAHPLLLLPAPPLQLPLHLRALYQRHTLLRGAQNRHHALMHSTARRRRAEPRRALRSRWGAGGRTHPPPSQTQTSASAAGHVITITRVATRCTCKAHPRHGFAVTMWAGGVARNWRSGRGRSNRSMHSGRAMHRCQRRFGLAGGHARSAKSGRQQRCGRSERSGLQELVSHLRCCMARRARHCTCFVGATAARFGPDTTADACFGTAVASTSVRTQAARVARVIPTAALTTRAAITGAPCSETNGTPPGPVCCDAAALVVLAGGKSSYRSMPARCKAHRLPPRRTVAAWYTAPPMAYAYTIATANHGTPAQSSRGVARRGGGLCLACGQPVHRSLGQRAPCTAPCHHVRHACTSGGKAHEEDHGHCRPGGGSQCTRCADQPVRGDAKVGASRAGAHDVSTERGVLHKVPAPSVQGARGCERGARAMPSCM